ncbi:hypothetical protein ACFE04_017036 [Oxalis oulophora]
MEDRKEYGTGGSFYESLKPTLLLLAVPFTKNAPWLSVPQFGDWDQKGPLPDYSLDFSKIREMRKQNKRDVSRASLGNEEELINPTAKTANEVRSDNHLQNEHYHNQNHHPSTYYPEKSCHGLLLVMFKQGRAFSAASTVV